MFDVYYQEVLVLKLKSWRGLMKMQQLCPLKTALYAFIGSSSAGKVLFYGMLVAM